jgi:hypothetical protein
MLCTCGFALATVPKAALLLTIYTFIVCAATLSTAKTFGARLMAEADTAHQ